MFELSFHVFRLTYVNVVGVRAELPLCPVSCLGDCLLYICFIYICILYIYYNTINTSECLISNTK